MASLIRVRFQFAPVVPAIGAVGGAARGRTGEHTLIKKNENTQPNASKRSFSAGFEEGAVEAIRSPKAAAVNGLLKQDGGAFLEQLMKATGWQKHPVRRFLAGALRKRHGIQVVSANTDGVRRYQVEAIA